MERESATERCPKCRRQFRVLTDEVNDHDCPYCGYTREQVQIDAMLAESYEKDEEDGDSDE